MIAASSPRGPGEVAGWPDPAAGEAWAPAIMLLLDLTRAGRCVRPFRSSARRLSAGVQRLVGAVLTCNAGVRSRVGVAAREAQPDTASQVSRCRRLDCRPDAG